VEPEPWFDVAGSRTVLDLEENRGRMQVVWDIFGTAMD
jgi:hypothetical protein